MTTATAPTKLKRYSVRGPRELIQNTIDAIRSMEPFSTAGSMRAVRGNIGLTNLNKLNRAEYDSYCRVANHILYVVFSYDTPIAWAYRAVDSRGTLPEPGQAASHVQWVRTTRWFSSATQRQQRLVSDALMGIYWQEAGE